MMETAPARRVSVARHDTKGGTDNPVTATELAQKAPTQLVAGGSSEGRADELMPCLACLRPLDTFAGGTSTPGMLVPKSVPRGAPDA